MKWLCQAPNAHESARLHFFVKKATVTLSFKFSFKFSFKTLHTDETPLSVLHPMPLVRYISK
jgi:hypothetical protein